MARKLRLYAAPTDNGWRIIKRVAFELGEAMVAADAATRVFDEFNKHVGYKLVDPQTHEASLPERTSSASITARESLASAGVCGKSVTKAMREEQRVTRVHSQSGKKLPAEDFIELAQEKVATQTVSANFAEQADGRSGDRAPRVYPKAVKW
jgi:hypothetical protein